MTKSLQFWISGVNNDSCINILDKVESIIHSIIFTELDDYIHESLRLWKRGFFNDQKFTILNEWCQRWYQHHDCLRKESIITQDSIILTELEDYRHEYLRLWMSDAFNDQKFTILNEWSQRCSQHPDSLRNSIVLTELEDCRHVYLRL